MFTIAMGVSFQFSFEYLSERLSMRVFVEFESVSSVGVCFFQTEYLSIVIFTGRTDAEAETPIVCPPDAKK